MVSKKKTESQSDSQDNVATEPQDGTTAVANGKKTKCPVTREQFKSSAKPLAVTIDGQLKGATVREFNGKSGTPDGTGSFGWSINEKMDILVDGVPCKAQVGLNIVLVGSKAE